MRISDEELNLFKNWEPGDQITIDMVSVGLLIQEVRESRGLNASQPSPVVVPEIEPAVKLLADVLHLWIDGYITKSSNSAAPLSISSDVFDSIERFLIANRITVDYCGWSAQPAPLPSNDDDNFTAAARFAGITFSQGCQFHLMMQHLLGNGPAPGFLPSAQPASLPSDDEWEAGFNRCKELAGNIVGTGNAFREAIDYLDPVTAKAALPVGQKETK